MKKLLLGLMFLSTTASAGWSSDPKGLYQQSQINKNAYLVVSQGANGRATPGVVVLHSPLCEENSYSNLVRIQIQATPVNAVVYCDYSRNMLVQPADITSSRQWMRELMENDFTNVQSPEADLHEIFDTRNATNKRLGRS